MKGKGNKDEQKLNESMLVFILSSNQKEKFDKLFL